ncbi:MAG: RHS repeat-associated core domain-containing protein [Bacteroidota bacterium]
MEFPVRKYNRTSLNWDRPSQITYFKHSSGVNKASYFYTQYNTTQFRINWTLTFRYRYQYNGIEALDEFGLNLNHAAYRLHDPELGRWLSVDPKATALMGLSPYNSMGNSPMVNADPNGDLFFAMPRISIGSGGVSFGLEVGIGVPGAFNASVTGGAGTNGAFWSVQGQTGALYAGYGSNGAFAGLGYQYGGFSGGYDFGSGRVSIGLGGGLGHGMNGSVGVSYGKGGFGWSASTSSIAEYAVNSDFDVSRRFRLAGKEENANLSEVYAMAEDCCPKTIPLDDPRRQMFNVAYDEDGNIVLFYKNTGERYIPPENIFEALGRHFSAGIGGLSGKYPWKTFKGIGKFKTFKLPGRKTGKLTVKLLKENKTDFSKVKYSRGKPFMPNQVNPQPKSRWAKVLDLFFGNFDHPGM